MNCVLGGWKTHGFSSGICCFDELCVGRLENIWTFCHFFMFSLICSVWHFVSRMVLAILSTHLMADSHWRDKEGTEKKCVPFRDDS